MRSSDRFDLTTRATWRLGVVAVVVGVWAGACSAPPRAAQPAAESAAQTAASPSARASIPFAVPACAVAAGRSLAPQERETIDALQKSVEAGPLFATSSGASAIASCRIGMDDGMASLEYQFKDGGWLRAKRNQAIEYSDVEAHFAAPPAEDPIAILTRAEQGAFGGDGCGIDWKKSESRPVSDERGATDTIFRGDSCNCQARIRSDANARVVGLILRSAC